MCLRLAINQLEQSKIIIKYCFLVLKYWCWFVSLLHFVRQCVIVPQCMCDGRRDILLCVVSFLLCAPCEVHDVLVVPIVKQFMLTHLHSRRFLSLTHNIIQYNTIQYSAELGASHGRRAPPRYRAWFYKPEMSPATFRQRFQLFLPIPTETIVMLTGQLPRFVRTSLIIQNNSFDVHKECGNLPQFT